MVVKHMVLAHVTRLLFLYYCFLGAKETIPKLLSIRLPSRLLRTHLKIPQALNSLFLK